MTGQASFRQPCVDWTELWVYLHTFPLPMPLLCSASSAVVFGLATTILHDSQRKSGTSDSFSHLPQSKVTATYHKMALVFSLKLLRLPSHTRSRKKSIKSTFENLVLCKHLTSFLKSDNSECLALADTHKYVRGESSAQTVLWSQFF